MSLIGQVSFGQGFRGDAFAARLIFGMLTNTSEAEPLNFAAAALCL